MKKLIKIIVFIIATLFIIIVIGVIKQSLKQSGESAIIMWIAAPLISILYWIMFGKFGKKSDNENGSGDIQLKK